MTHVMPPFRRKRLPTPLLLRDLVASVYKHNESLVGAVVARAPTGSAQRVGGIVKGVENVVLAIAVRVHFRFAMRRLLLLREGFGFGFRARRAGAGLGMDQGFYALASRV